MHCLQYKKRRLFQRVATPLLQIVSERERVIWVGSKFPRSNWLRHVRSLTGPSLEKTGLCWPCQREEGGKRPWAHSRQPAFDSHPLTFFPWGEGPPTPQSVGPTFAFFFKIVVILSLSVVDLCLVALFAPGKFARSDTCTPFAGLRGSLVHRQHHLKKSWTSFIRWPRPKIEMHRPHQGL